MPDNGAGFRSLDAEIGKCVLACTTAYARVYASTSISRYVHRKLKERLTKQASCVHVGREEIAFA